MSRIVYRGYAVHSTMVAIEKYIKDTGKNPTLIVCRPDYLIIDQCDILMRSSHAGANMLMVTHLASTDESMQDIFQKPTKDYIEEDNIDNRAFGNQKMSGIPKQKVGRPPRIESICPHCAGKISDFEKLGYWYGWALGIIPPYWEELRDYVFRRDEFMCGICYKKYIPSLLVPHHIQPKEEFGNDSAKNLMTVCVYCHQDTKPIMPEKII